MAQYIGLIHRRHAYCEATGDKLAVAAPMSTGHVVPLDTLPGISDHSNPSRHHDALRELCHDLLQPVATIGALIAAAQVEAQLPRAAKDRLSQVSLEVKRMAELCHHGLHQGADRADVALHELATHAAAAASLTSAGTVRVSTEPATVHADATALRRAVANLLDNGIRAAGPNGEVLVTVHVDGQWTKTTIADSGDGFGTGASGVAGLGLRIAGRVAHEHGGEVTVGRSAELGGAAVTLSLPTPFPRYSIVVVDEAVQQ